jgi:hypothetical protein
METPAHACVRWFAIALEVSTLRRTSYPSNRKQRLLVGPELLLLVFFWTVSEATNDELTSLQTMHFCAGGSLVDT